MSKTLGRGLSALMGESQPIEIKEESSTKSVPAPQKTKKMPAVNKTTAKKTVAKKANSKNGAVKTVPAKSESSKTEVKKPVKVETSLETSSNILPVDKLKSGVFQPRHNFNEQALEDLATSIKANGIMQPLLVRFTSDEGMYEIVAGERRWQAAKKAGLKTVPVIIKEIPDSQALELALVENIQRESLTPLEEAKGYKQLIEDFGHTQEQLAKTVGKSRSHIANLMRLLSLPLEVKTLLDEGKISMGHARALVGSEHAAEIAKKAAEQSLNVRQVERLVKLNGLEPGKYQEKSYRIAQKDSEILELEQILTQNIGLKVSIKETGNNRGEVVIKYNNASEMDGIIRKISGDSGI